MLIVDRYLLRHFLKNFLFALLSFVTLYLLIDVFSTLQDIVKNKPPVEKILELYIYSAPTIISHVAPLATLLATLFTLGQQNQANEIIAMRAAGLSIWRIIRPMAVFAFIFSLGLFLLEETVAPHARKMSRYIRNQVIEKKGDTPGDLTLENVAVYGFDNRLFFINKLHPKTSEIEGLTILEHDERQNVKSKIYAERAVWRNNRWVLYQCFIYHLSDDRKIKGEPLYFSDTPFKIEETPQDFLSQNVAVEDMNTKELAGYIARLASSRETPTISRLKVTLFQKTSQPFTALVTLLIGIPTAVVIRRRAVAFSSIGLCLALSFFFYVAFSVSVALGKGGAFPPLLAAWISHFLFGAAALFFIARIP